jgi:hypothetical protein
MNRDCTERNAHPDVRVFPSLRHHQAHDPRSSLAIRDLLAAECAARKIDSDSDRAFRAVTTVPIWKPVDFIRTRRQSADAAHGGSIA